MKRAANEKVPQAVGQSTTFSRSDETFRALLRVILLCNLIHVVQHSSRIKTERHTAVSNLLVLISAAYGYKTQDEYCTNLS
ncbi:hypothetical protein NQ317_003592, partial [Molorchus minor]